MHSASSSAKSTMLQQMNWDYPPFFRLPPAAIVATTTAATGASRYCYSLRLHFASPVSAEELAAATATVPAASALGAV